MMWPSKKHTACLVLASAPSIPALAQDTFPDVPANHWAYEASGISPGIEILRGAMVGFWIAFAVSALLALPILRGLIRLKSRQTVSQYVPEHAAKQGTPTMGGLIIVAGMLGAGLWMAFGVGGSSVTSYAPLSIVSRSVPDKSLLAYLLLFVGFAAIGFADDFIVPRLMPGKRGLGWKQKFGLEIAIGAVVMLLIPRVDLWAICLGTFLILFYSNAFNFADGMDGLASGVGIPLLGALAVIGAFRFGSSVAVVSLCLIGSFLPFLFLNAPPARVFMGDVGSLPVGAAMGLMVWELTRRRTIDYPLNVAGAGLSIAIPAVFVLSLVLAYELIPVPLQIASVKLRKKRMFLMTPIHHAFQKKGIPETRVVWGFIVAQIVLSALAVTIVIAAPSTGTP